MHSLLLVVYLLIVIALVTIILLQKSEGGGFISNNSSSFMNMRGSKNALTRLTAILATAFFVIAIILVILDSRSNSVSDILNRIPQNASQARANSQVPIPANPAPPAADQQASSDGNKPAIAPAKAPEVSSEKKAAPAQQPAQKKAPFENSKTAPKAPEQNIDDAGTNKAGEVAAPSAKQEIAPAAKQAIKEPAMSQQPSTKDKAINSPAQ